MGIELATTYILIAILTLFFILLLSGTRRHHAVEFKPVRGDDLDVWPFMPRVFMTNAEVRFFHQLKQAVPEFLIFSQVGLSRLIECTDEEDEKFWFNRINRMSVDYVLVDQDGQNVLVAIELDDWSHESLARNRADLKKDKALISAGIPMVRFHGEDVVSAAEIRQELLHALEQRREWVTEAG
jgi:very-short-patch-repair endonuclease